MKILGVANIGLADYRVIFTYRLVAKAAASLLFRLDSRVDSAVLLVLSVYDKHF